MIQYLPRGRESHGQWSRTVVAVGSALTRTPGDRSAAVYGAVLGLMLPTNHLACCVTAYHVIATGSS